MTSLSEMKSSQAEILNAQVRRKGPLDIRFCMDIRSRGIKQFTGLELQRH